ncbi:MAG TPA: hypothetical protein DC047_18095 [Blastocatellia bacterium]|nr:hypothetical protein [Blastocatellia bacterium]
MGFFRTFLLGERSAISPPIDSSALLREATSQKAAGDINSAIELLRQFWLAEPFGSSGYGVEEYLRLPMYLQHAGLRDDAWGALNVLLTDYVLTPTKLNDQCLPMMHSEIYDKMRLFWQREGEPSIAVKYGILSHVHWLIGLHRQRRREELRDCAGPEAIVAVVEPLLKKAKKIRHKNSLCVLVESEVLKLPSLDVHSFAGAIDQLILTNQER